jgi:fucose 4-O-acetylase-like acetyltransferase
MKTIKKGRIDYLDGLRGLAIFLMVMGHVLAWIFSDCQKAFDSNLSCGLVWKFIYAFHMPLFMFVSGYFFRFSNEESLLQNALNLIYKKFVALLIPFATMGYLLWVVRDNGVEYWFLRTLFELFVLCLPFYIVSNKINKNNKLIVDLLIFGFGYCLLFGGFHFLNAELKTILDAGRIVNHYPYFVFGFLLRKHEILQKILQKNVVYSLSLIIFLTLFFLGTLGYFSMGGIIGFALKYIIPFSAIFALYYFFIYIYRERGGKKVGVLNLFSYLGTHSIEIYLIHFFFTFRLTELGDYLIGIEFYGTSLLIQIVYSIIVSMIVIGISLGVYRIISKSKVLSFILFGKKQNFAEMFKL